MIGIYRFTMDLSAKDFYFLLFLKRIHLILLSSTTMKMTQSLLALLLISTASGCALNAKSVNLVADNPPQVLVCYDALQKTLAIAPPIDERPGVEKAGSEPHGIYLLLWNQRIGNYISGDKDFLDPVAPTMPEQIGRAVSRTHCFYETKTLKTAVPQQPGPEDLLVLFAKEKAHYVLVSRLQHFYGEQRQKAYFYALPLFFVDLFGYANGTDNAQGHTEILFILYDTQLGQEVLREKVVGEANSSMRASFPQMAKESFADASNKAANVLYRFAQLQQGSPVFNAEQV